jgi:hypothetical protein
MTSPWSCRKLQDMNDLPSWIVDDPHAVMQLILEGEVTIDGEETLR